jgi:hypothetical protein
MYERRYSKSSHSKRAVAEEMMVATKMPVRATPTSSRV